MRRRLHTGPVCLRERSRVGARWRRCDGAAIPEFIMVTMGLLIPIGYMVVAIAQVLAAHAAAAHSVREAGRVFVRDSSVHAGQWRAQQAAAIAFADRGLHLPDHALRLECMPSCLMPGGSVRVSVNWDMPLPWLPDAIADAVSVPITASEEFVIDTYRPEGV
jgi:hypothetical protein